MSILISIITLFFFLATPSPIHAASPVELLKDTQFANGFGACFWFGQNYTPGPEWLKMGLCQAYRPSVAPYIKVIPDNDPSKTVAQNNENKYWEFNDGIHENYTREDGVHINELLDHKLNYNYQLLDNGPNILNISQTNPAKGIVKQVSTNKNGKIYFHYNSKNDFRNIANTYLPTFAYDTWPTFQISQKFRTIIDLANYDDLTVSLQPKIYKWDWLPGWPYSNEVDKSLNLYTFIREKDYPRGMFVGMALYTTDILHNHVFPDGHIDNLYPYTPLYDLDQLGQGFYRDDVRLYGGPAAVSPAEYKTIHFNLLQLIDKALITGNVKRPDGSQRTHDDYILQNFDLGIEGLGYFDVSYDIQNVSITGTEKSTSSTPSPSPTPSNTPTTTPSSIKGYLGTVSCKTLTGWAGDTNHPTKQVNVHFYYDGSHLLGAVTANQTQGQAVCEAIGSTESPCNHGFSYTIPALLLDGHSHTIDAYAIGESGNNPKLADSGKIITCASTTGDLTNDGHINDDDFTVIKAKFGNPYTIYDYNSVIENFGK